MKPSFGDRSSRTLMRVYLRVTPHGQAVNAIIPDDSVVSAILINKTLQVAKIPALTIEYRKTRAVAAGSG
jgi:hypothetical protein